jgi:hypoxanthine phosphoribosyltransferase
MPVLCVRKDTDTCHSCFRIEGNIDAKKCVIVDDFISTGKTVKFICKMLKDSYKAISCEAVLLYTPCASGLRYQWIDAYQKYIPCFYSRDKDITKNIKTQGRIPKDTFDLRKIQ